MAFELTSFRALFPQFASVLDSVVKAVAEQAACYDTGACKGECAEQLLLLMVAHLLALRAKAALGGGLAITSASEGGVSVSVAQPADPNARSIWLNGTPYGQQYAALESKCTRGRAAAGLYFGHLPEGRGFRKVRGTF